MLAKMSAKQTAKAKVCCFNCNQESFLSEKITVTTTKKTKH